MVDRYIVSTTALIMTLDSKVLVVKRSDGSVRFPGKFGAVGGKMESSDGQLTFPGIRQHVLEDTILREIKEETGLQFERKELSFFDTVVDETEKILVVTFLVPIYDVSERVKITLTPEHSRYRWIDDREIDLLECIPELPAQIKYCLSHYCVVYSR